MGPEDIGGRGSALHRDQATGNVAVNEGTGPPHKSRPDPPGPARRLVRRPGRRPAAPRSGGGPQPSTRMTTTASTISSVRTTTPSRIGAGVPVTAVRSCVHGSPSHRWAATRAQGGTSTRRSPLCTSQPEHSAQPLSGEARLGELGPSEKHSRKKILNGRKSVTKAGAHPGQNGPLRILRVSRRWSGAHGPPTPCPGSTIPEDTEAEVLLQDWQHGPGPRSRVSVRTGTAAGASGSAGTPAPRWAAGKAWYLYDPAFHPAVPS